MIALFYFLLFVLGSVMGSFINVLDLRYDPNRSVFDSKRLSGRSKCMSCGKTLTAVELIPILSFILQRGRCRSCKKKISFQYPIVEATAGFIFLTVALTLNNFFSIASNVFFNLEAPAIHYFLVFIWSLAFLVWLLITLIDLKHYLVPDELNLTLGFFGLLLLALTFLNQGYFSGFRDSFLTHYNLIFSPLQNPGLNHLLGGLIGFIFFAAFSILSRGRAMGMGDAKLALPTGLLLGWADIGLAIALSFILGGIAGVILIRRKEKTMHDRIPFAPFFVLGVALTFFFGHSIIAGYFALFPLS